MNTQRIYRPPSEAESYILQATYGCSWNKCTYCAMYRGIDYQVRNLADCLNELQRAGATCGRYIDKLFVADGDALAMPMEHWLPILQAAPQHFPHLRQISCYATAMNILNKTPAELQTLRQHGLKLLYIGPESGDDLTLKRIAKGANAADHVQAAQLAHDAGMMISTIMLLGVAGVERSQAHAEATADLVTAMNPEFLAALTTMVIPDTPLFRMQVKGKYESPSVDRMLRELRTIVANSRPTDALFRTNHASNYLPLAGRLPQDRERIVTTIDKALSGQMPLRSEFLRGL